MTRATITIFAIFFLAVTQAALAADDQATIHAVGSSTKLFVPNIVRARCHIFSEGATGGSAIKKLVASRALLERRFTAKAGRNRTHTFGPIVEHKESQGSFQEIQMKAMQNMMGGGNQPDDDADKYIRLNFTLTLEWTLKGDAAEEHIRYMDEIRAELESLGLNKSEKKMSGEGEADSEDDDREDDEPTTESAEDSQDRLSGVKVRMTDGPLFSYLRRLSDREIDESAAEAFNDAKRRAARFAYAAGAKLGKLVQIAGGGINHTEVQKSELIRMTEMFGEAPAKFEEDSLRPATEIVSDTFKPIPYTFDVSVTFGVE